MRLLYFVDEWPSLFERYLYREIQWMKDRGHSVSVVSLNCAPYGYKSETNHYVDLAEFDLQEIPVLQLDSKQMLPDAIRAETLGFARLHQAEFIDAHLGREPAELACQVHCASGIPYAVRLRGGEIHTKTSPKLAEFLFYASAVCPMSQFLADVMTGARILKKMPQDLPVEVDREKLHVVPNSLPRRYLAASPVPQSDDVQVIGAIGRAVPNKRFQDVIAAVTDLVYEFPAIKLKIVGGGWTFQELQAMAAQAGVSDRVEITGFKSWAETVDMARQFHIYVQSSELEGCSLSTIEASFQGVPLVLSRTGANEQCVQEGMNGFLFDPGDVTALRENLRSLLRAGARKREQMGRATLEIVGELFSAEKIMPRLEAIFLAALDESAQAQPTTVAAMGIASGDHND